MARRANGEDLMSTSPSIIAKAHEAEHGHVYEATANGRRAEVITDGDKETARLAGAVKLGATVDETLVRYLWSRVYGR